MYPSSSLVFAKCLLGMGLVFYPEISTIISILWRMKPMLRRVRDLFKDAQFYSWDSSPALHRTKCYAGREE